MPAEATFLTGAFADPSRLESGISLRCFFLLILFRAYFLAVASRAVSESESESESSVRPAVLPQGVARLGTW